MRNIGLRHVLVVVVSMAASSVLVRPGSSAPPPVDATCATGSAPTTHTGAALDSFTPIKDGVVYDGSIAALELQKAGGNFKQALLGVSDPLYLTCAGDFDEDGWTDFIGAGDGSSNSFVRFYKNRTYENPAPDWSDINAIRTPKFVATTEWESPSGRNYGTGAAQCIDVDNDGNLDFLYVRCDAGVYSNCTPTRADVFLGTGTGSFSSKYKFVTNFSSLSNLGSSAVGIVPYDYNGDGRIDLIWGLTNSSTESSRRIQVFLNDGGTKPKFVPSVNLLTAPGLGTLGPGALAAADFTGDGVMDMLVGSPTSPSLRLYPGLLGGGVAGAYQSIPFVGAATALLSADFSLDGRIDLVTGTDNFNWNAGHQGGKAHFYENDGDTIPFSGGAKSQLSDHQDPHSPPQRFDYDSGFVFDYDHDPLSTPDVLIADGNNSSNYYLFVNRGVGTYVDCGTVASGVLDIGGLSSVEMTVTEVRIDPSEVLNGGSIGWEASNDGGTTWHTMTPCADDPTEYCVAFTNTVGNEIRWRANMCANAGRTQTPRITGVGVEFTYVTASNHFRAGPIASDGLIFVGAFRAPGDAGRFYAVSDETGSVVWDSATILEGLASRTMYTVASDGTRLDFSTANATSTQLQNTLLAPDAATATAIVSWQRSARFGLTTKQVMGGVENSTAALLSPPRPPPWYNDDDTPPAERTLIDAYIAAHQNRERLVFVGSKDGALHAMFVNPFDASDPDNGKEMWAFVPHDVAQRLNTDRTTGVVTAYPDGSPTLTSAKLGGTWRTVLVAGEGNGGRHVFALDVTETLDPATRGVIGPTPLWSFSDANMGRTYSKPAVARVKDGGVEKWLAIFASGPGLTSDLGDSVYAVDLATGTLVWRFDLDDTNAYIATDVTVAETDDEPGTKIDGFIDRVFFADNKGRVWKLDPANHTGTTIAPVGSPIDVPGLAHDALFSTELTSSALGEARAIAGTLAAAEDPIDQKLVLYFGTGGTEETPASAQNAFYAVEADTGAIRNKLIPDPGVKFYGGIAVNEGQIILSAGTDLSGLGLCAPSAGEIVAIDQISFSPLFTIPVGAKIVAPVFIQKGEFYTVNLKGELITSEYTGPATVFGSTPPPPGPPNPGDVPGVTNQPFSVLSWRQVK